MNSFFSMRAGSHSKVYSVALISPADEFRSKEFWDRFFKQVLSRHMRLSPRLLLFLTRLLPRFAPPCSAAARSSSGTATGSSLARSCASTTATRCSSARWMAWMSLRRDDGVVSARKHSQQRTSSHPFVAIWTLLRCVICLPLSLRVCSGRSTSARCSSGCLPRSESMAAA